MSATLTAAKATLRSRDRATTILTVLAFAFPHAILLSVTGGVCAFVSRASNPPAGFSDVATFYVVMACFAATLMTVPILSMGGSAARLGLSRRARDLAVLRLIGLKPGQTRLACVIETAVYALVGVVVGSILYAACLPGWTLISFQGIAVSVGEMWVGPLILIAEAALMMVLAAASAMLAMRRVAVTPLGVSRRSDVSKVSPVGLGIMVALMLVWLFIGGTIWNAGIAIGLSVLLGFMGVIFALVNVVGALSVSVLGRVMSACARTPQMMLAGRRITDDPKSVWRSFGAIALVAFLVGVLMPLFEATSVSSSPDMEETSVILLGDIRTGMLLTFGITLVLGAISTAINQGIRVIDSIDQIKALEYMGSPAKFLDRSRRLEIMLPAVLMIGGALVLGLCFMSPVLTMGVSFSSMGIFIGMTAGGVALILLASESTGPLRRRLLSDMREGMK